MVFLVIVVATAPTYNSPATRGRYLFHQEYLNSRRCAASNNGTGINIHKIYACHVMLLLVVVRFFFCCCCFALREQNTTNLHIIIIIFLASHSQNEHGPVAAAAVARRCSAVPLSLKLRDEDERMNSAETIRKKKHNNVAMLAQMFVENLHRGGRAQCF